MVSEPEGLGGSPAAARPAAVVLGGSSNSLSVARSLGKQGIEVHGLGDGAGGQALSRSRFVREYLAPPASGSVTDGWDAWLKQGPVGAVLLPCSDIALEYLATHRDRLAGEGYLLPESTDAVTLAMLDKSRTYALARSIGVPAPLTAEVDSETALRAVIGDFTFPCALKPRHSHRFAKVFGQKAIVTQDREELLAAFRAVNAEGMAMIVTEIIPGGDDRYCSYYSYLTPEGEALFHFTKRKPRQNPPGFGLGTYHVSEWLPDVAEMGLRFFEGVGLTGIGNVEFKRDPRDGSLKLIECNPRFTGADKLVVNAGVDMATIAYRRVVGLPVSGPTTFRSGVRQWHPYEDVLAFRAYREAGQLSTWQWLRSLLHRQHLPVFDAADPMPTVVYDIGFLRQKVRGALRRLRSAGARRR